MITRQILFSALLLGAMSNNALAMERDQEVRRFDEGWHTVLNNLNSDVFFSIIFNEYKEDDNINIIEIADNKLIQLCTIKSFSTYYTETPDLGIDIVTINGFWNAVKKNNALFDSKKQTIFYGSETDINNYYNKYDKIELLDEKLKSKKARLRFNKEFVKRYCKEDQCTILKAEIEKTEKEINQLYQNL